MSEDYYYYQRDYADPPPRDLVSVDDSEDEGDRLYLLNLQRQQKMAPLMLFLYSNAYKLLLVVFSLTALMWLSAVTPAWLGSGSGHVDTPLRLPTTTKLSVTPIDFKTQSNLGITLSDFKSYTPTVGHTTGGYSSAAMSVLEYAPWDIIAEPYKVQVVNVTVYDEQGIPVSLSENGIGVEWTIAGQTYQGETATFTLTDIAIHSCSLKFFAKKRAGSAKAFTFLQRLPGGILSSGDDDKANSEDDPCPDPATQLVYGFNIAVKYIRRELRRLTDSDREKALSAMKTMYTLSDAEGQALYGSKYVSIETLLYHHLIGAGTSDCDHWHDGAGIVTHHAAVTLVFEQSLQAMDPSLSLPYWEYGRDAIAFADYMQSNVFQDGWFGSASPNTADHSLAQGRFSGIVTPDGTKYARKWSQKDSGSMNPFSNPYGFMRTPWNLNPSPYFGRRNLTFDTVSYTALPGCGKMEACYDSDTLSDVSELLCL